MKYDQFVSEHPERAKLVNPGTLRTWRARGVVPDHAVSKMPVETPGTVSNADATPQSVSKPVASATAPVSKAKSVSNPGLKAQGVPEGGWPTLTPEYCASKGYVVGKPLSWEQIEAIFTDSRALLARAA